MWYLKPCPFCKSEEVSAIKETSYGDPPTIAIKCHSCFCRGPQFSTLNKTYEEAIGEAALHWNTRPELD